MEWGSFADWASACSGFLAVLAAGAALWSGHNMLRIERNRDDDQRSAEARAQAELVFALGTKTAGADGTGDRSIYLYNGSAKPVFNIVVRSTKVGSGAPNPPLKLGALPPGRFLVHPHERYHWGSLIDLGEQPEPVDFMVKGKGYGMIESLSFEDARRRPWILRHGTELDGALADPRP